MQHHEPHAERLAPEEREGRRASSSTYDAPDISPDMSFLEMLDVLNEHLIAKGEDPIAFDHDCREGICGTCGIVINGMPHGPRRATTTCQLHMRQLQGRRHDHASSRGARRPFPVIKDLVVDRSALRPHHPGGRLHLGRAPAARPTATRSRCRRRAAGPRDGRGGLHRLRRLRGGLPERLGDALRRRQGLAPRRCCRRASPSATSACSRWSRRWTPRASAPARTTASARAPARRRSAGVHRAAEPRLLQGDSHEPPEGRGERLRLDVRGR